MDVGTGEVDADDGVAGGLASTPQRGTEPGRRTGDGDHSHGPDRSVRAVHDLRALVDGYAVAADERDADAFAALFTPDATLTVLVDGEQRGRYAGADEIGTVPAKLARYRRTLHLVSTHHSVVDDDEDEATGTAYCEAHHVDDDGDRVLFIRYDDRYVRTPDGWRFAARAVNTLWSEQR